MDKIYNVTYILKCRDGSLYTGWTNDMKKRYVAHVSGKGGKYTKSHPPVGIAYLEVSETKEEAMRREFAIKQMTRPKKEEMIAESGWREALPEELKDELKEWFFR
ncbi:MAG: GIY-YIG nuclease family protein [Eubacterium sp.]|nr:GIY-YIG nuclease family protein [Eubacterium sp.]